MSRCRCRTSDDLCPRCESIAEDTAASRYETADDLADYAAANDFYDRGR